MADLLEVASPPTGRVGGLFNPVTPTSCDRDTIPSVGTAATPDFARGCFRYPVRIRTCTQRTKPNTLHCNIYLTDTLYPISRPDAATKRAKGVQSTTNLPTLSPRADASRTDPPCDADDHRKCSKAFLSLIDVLRRSFCLAFQQGRTANLTSTRPIAVATIHSPHDPT